MPDTDTLPPRGQELAVQAANWATEQYARHLDGLPSEWSQFNWCGTRRCLAGQIVQLHGWLPLVEGAARVHRDGHAEFADDIATDLLVGPDPDPDTFSRVQALWYATNDLIAIWEGIQAIWPSVEIPDRVYALMARSPAPSVDLPPAF